MSFIDLRLVMEDGIAQGIVKPGDAICPIMSAVEIGQAPMEKHPSLNLKSVLCIKEMCGMYAKCANIPAKAS